MNFSFYDLINYKNLIEAGIIRPEFIISISVAISGTTINAFLVGPYFLDIAVIFASPAADDPIDMPANPAQITAAS